MCEGLGHPEGPDVLPDGSVVFANTYAGEIAIWNPRNGLSTYARTGGGPNACTIGSDGAVYVTQCPTVGGWSAPETRPPSIQRISDVGQVEVVVTKADGTALISPNDLTFGPDGRLYFTDSGSWDPAARLDRGLICVVERDGECHVLEELDAVYPNGIVAEPDGSIVWVESYTRRVVRRRPDGEISVIHTLAPNHIPDGFKIDSRGTFWITAFSAGGLDVIARDGSFVEFVSTGGVPLNCVFDDTTLFVCDFGTTDTGAAASMGGRLLRINLDVSGMPLFRGAIS